MNKKEQFINLIKDFWKNDIVCYVGREKQFKTLNIRKIWTIIGPRRAGKTYFVYQTIDLLLKKGVNKKNILYLYLDRSDIFPLNLKDLDILLETFFELVGYNKNEKYFVFLDEIQIIDGREKFATKVYNDFPNIELILTGSTSDLFSSQLSSGLRGKATNLEILPLDFLEVLKFKGLKYEKYLSTTQRLEYAKVFNEILLYGSFPEIVKLKSFDEKKKILEDYLDIMLFKDVVERYNLKAFKKLKYFQKLIVSYMGDFVNFSKIAREIGADYNSILSWRDYFSSSYLFFELKNFDFSIGKQITSQSKIYVLDNGYYSVNFYDYKYDFGKLFENWFFMEVRKMGYRENKNIFYFKSKDFDIDFVLVDGKDVKFIQVVYELNDENYDREVVQLIKIVKQYGGEGILVYKDNFTDKENGEIKILPYYRIFEII